MNVKEILGMKIIDKDGKEIAKLSDLRFDVKTYKVTSLYGSAGNPISKKYYEIDPESIIAIGDYLIVSQTLDDLSENILTKIETNETTSTTSQALEKTVIDKEGNVAGKITNIEIETKPLLITNLVVEKQSSFGKSKTRHIINKDDITSSGDYVMLNKTLDDDKQEDEE